jgi:hypothetical protein
MKSKIQTSISVSMVSPNQHREHCRAKPVEAFSGDDKNIAVFARVYNSNISVEFAKQVYTNLISTLFS